MTDQTLRHHTLRSRLAGAYAAATLVLSPELLLACSHCFGLGVENATTRGISFAMFGLLLMLGVVWGGIGAFAVRVRRRSRLLEPEDWTVGDDGEIQPRSDTD